MNDTTSPAPGLLQLLSWCGLGLLASACGSGSGGDVLVTDPSGILPVSEVHAFRPDSPWSNALKRCVLIDDVSESCALSTLPFIGNGARPPGADEILDRVLVTHDWMGQRVAALLADASPELRLLFGSTTAIVIGSDIRPSNYNSLHGAIRLDPEMLWLTVDEKRTVSVDEDFRSSYGAELQFRHYTRWALGEERAWEYFDLADDSERTLDDIRLPVMRLLYHELAHANDFMPRERLASLDPSSSVFDAIWQDDFDWVNERVALSWPLLSDELLGLAGVRYRDEIASDLQKSYRADNVGSLMASDAGMRFYSYSTEAEDVATTLTAALMYQQHGVTLNIAYTDKPVAGAVATCDDLSVGWGVRNRMGDPVVLWRALALLELMLGTDGTELDRLQRELAATQVLMRFGESWCTNHRADPPLASTAGLRSRPATDPHATHENENEGAHRLHPAWPGAGRVRL